jgi:hypothetical protein
MSSNSRKGGSYISSSSLCRSIFRSARSRSGQHQEQHQ